MNTRDLSANAPYVPGRGVEEVARELGVDPDELVKLSSNENPFGPSPKAVAAAKAAAEDAHVYPKAAHTDLTEKLAAKWDLSPEQVWVSPGADGALDYLARATLAPGDTVLVPEPGFAYYPMSARYHHGEVATYPVEKADGFAQTADRILDAYDGERVVYVTSPHNPAGTELPREELVALLDGVDEETLVVADEAYGEYTDTPSAAGLLDEYENVAVTRTFSKAYGLAGLRIGYALVPEAWGDAYARVNTPFAANAVALDAAIAALDDDEHVERSVETAAWARDYIAAELDAPTFDSAGNFVLAEVGDGAAVAERAQARGVIVRDTGSFGLPECVRISCGTEAETRTAVETLNEVLAELGLGAEA
ncbi:histidinol-phosphate transaminase [Halobaculum litoreum]|uniref:Histidinol-phosphate aminotransferase n=1 Tax=Halobaculum litoreum TaxID=3031998 RepID=A0ABD5XQ01_9EURY|nr:histidinol-phosphate transaminase [Halobaculum sp. DT92]